MPVESAIAGGSEQSMKTRDMQRKLDGSGLAVASALIVGMLFILGERAGAQSTEVTDVVRVSAKGTSFALQNRAIAARWSLAEGTVSELVIADRLHQTEVRVGNPFRILLADGTFWMRRA